MGSSASMNINKDKLFDVFISYPFCKECAVSYEIEKLESALTQLDYKILNSYFTYTFINANLGKENLVKINSNVHPLLFTIPYIFICLSSKSISSVNQTLELNNIANINPSDVTIIYLLIEEDFIDESKVIIKKNKWFPFYDDETVFESINKIITMLINNNK